MKNLWHQHLKKMRKLSILDSDKVWYKTRDESLDEIYRICPNFVDNNEILPQTSERIGRVDEISFWCEEIFEGRFCQDIEGFMNGKRVRGFWCELETDAIALKMVWSV